MSHVHNPAAASTVTYFYNYNYLNMKGLNLHFSETLQLFLRRFNQSVDSQFSFQSKLLMPDLIADASRSVGNDLIGIPHGFIHGTCAFLQFLLKNSS